MNHEKVRKLNIFIIKITKESFFFFYCIYDELKLKFQSNLQLNVAGCETNGQAREAKRRAKEAQGCRRADRILIQLPNAGDS